MVARGKFHGTKLTSAQEICSIDCGYQLSNVVFISRYLQGLEQLQIPKPVKQDYGGGNKEFTIREVKKAKSLSLTKNDYQLNDFRVMHVLGFFNPSQDSLGLRKKGS